MTFSLSLPKSLDSQSLVAGLQGENAQKSAGSEGADGFAELLNQLASFIPGSQAAAGEGDDSLQERQILELPTGKDLPLAAIALPVLLPDAAGTGEAVDFTAINASLPSAINLPLPGGAPSLQVAVGPESGSAKPVVTITVGAAGEVQIGTEAAKLAAATGVTGEQSASGLQVRIAAAQEPRDAKLAGLTPMVEGGKAQVELPTLAAEPATRSNAAAQSAARPIAGAEIAAAAKADLPADPSLQAKVGTTPSTSAVEASVQAKLVAGDTAGTAPAKAGAAALAAAPAIENKAGAKRPSSRSERAGELAFAVEKKSAAIEAGIDKMESAQRATSSVDATKTVLHNAASRADVPAASAGAPAAAQRTAGTDQFANVERVVDQLMAARQVDLTKATAIAVAHKEFGTLTVSFDQSSRGMNVEIAAEDSEAHRALAAAMANDRSATRQADSMAQTASGNSHSGQASAERGATSGQSGANLGQGNADNQRSQNSDQRSRQGERAANNPQQSKPSSSDDALYA